MWKPLGWIGAGPACQVSFLFAADSLVVDCMENVTKLVCMLCHTIKIQNFCTTLNIIWCCADVCQDGSPVKFRCRCKIATRDEKDTLMKVCTDWMYHLGSISLTHLIYDCVKLCVCQSLSSYTHFDCMRFWSQVFNGNFKCPIICRNDELPPQCLKTTTDCNFFVCVNDRCAAVVSRWTVKTVLSSPCVFQKVCIHSLFLHMLCTLVNHREQPVGSWMALIDEVCCLQMWWCWYAWNASQVSLFMDCRFILSSYFPVIVTDLKQNATPFDAAVQMLVEKEQRKKQRTPFELLRCLQLPMQGWFPVGFKKLMMSGETMWILLSRVLANAISPSSHHSRMEIELEISLAAW